MIRFLPILLLLASCATGPAEVRVGFDRTHIRSTMARGVADRTTGRRASVDDPVRVASVSKFGVALAVMRLVEAGTLDLDRDVSDWLGWRLRNPAFPDKAITLRLLLSHRSSLTDNNDYAIPLGRTLRDVVADPKAWDATHAPGGWFAYTNLNFPVIASVIERATGERFDRAMARTVLTPLGIDACYNWTTCSAGALARGITLYDGDSGAVRRDSMEQRSGCAVNALAGCDLASYQLGTNGALFSPQGGLRISGRGLARIGQMLLNKGEGFLTPASIDTLFEIQWRFDGSNGDTSNGFYCSYGLATQVVPSRQAGCRDDLFGDGRLWVGHAGEAYGLRSGLWIDRAAGTGVAFFATAVPDKGAEGRKSAFTAAEERLARR
jgi:CubicO group peptidase (beta-lactamase class C family)